MGRTPFIRFDPQEKEEVTHLLNEAKLGDILQLYLRTAHTCEGIDALVPYSFHIVAGQNLCGTYRQLLEESAKAQRRILVPGRTQYMTVQGVLIDVLPGYSVEMRSPHADRRTIESDEILGLCVSPYGVHGSVSYVTAGHLEGRTGGVPSITVDVDCVMGYRILARWEDHMPQRYDEAPHRLGAHRVDRFVSFRERHTKQDIQHYLAIPRCRC